MTKNFKKTEKQKEASKLLANKNFTKLLFFGGSRSGKTFLLVFALVLRALKEPNSRHVILRYRFNHCKQSIWFDTLPKVLKTCFAGVQYKENKTDWFIEFNNGSQIWIGGLDDSARVEKILGTEYSTIYFNECSQIPYSSVVVAMTRLAQKTNLINKAFFDCNPPNTTSWLYKLFIAKLNPEDETPLKNPDSYCSLLINPSDNIENLNSNYIETLDSLPELKRRRFLLGEWIDDITGAIYGDAVAKAEGEGRITSVLYDPRFEVHTWWDTGHSDYTAIWFVQYVGREVRLIKYYQNNKRGYDFYIKYLKEQGYMYGKHNLPHDCGYGQFSSRGGASAFDLMKEMAPNFDFVVHPRTMNKFTDIENAAMFMSKCVFDKTNCYEGLEALRNYRKEYDEVKQIYKKEPVHDWTSHGADAFRYLAVGFDGLEGLEKKKENNIPFELLYPNYNNIRKSI